MTTPPKLMCRRCGAPSDEPREHNAIGSTVCPAGDREFMPCEPPSYLMRSATPRVPAWVAPPKVKRIRKPARAS